MSVSLAQTMLPGWRFCIYWLLATAAGAALAIVPSAPFQFALEAAIGGARTPPWTPTETALIILFKGIEGGLMGLGSGCGQWLVLRKYLDGTRGWVLATGLAWLAQTMFRWSLPPPTPPEQVFLAITLSSGLLLGLCQWPVLRGRVPQAGWWVAINLAGSALAIAFWAAPKPMQPPIYSPLWIVFVGVQLLLPFAVAAGGMVWLLRRAMAERAATASGVEA